MRAPDQEAVGVSRFQAVLMLALGMPPIMLPVSMLVPLPASIIVLMCVQAAFAGPCCQQFTLAKGFPGLMGMLELEASKSLRVVVLLPACLQDLACVEIFSGVKSVVRGFSALARVHMESSCASVYLYV